MINMTAVSQASFSVAEAKDVISPLFLFVLGVVIYAIFIFKFYRFLARKNIFELHLHKYSNFKGFLDDFFHIVFYIIEYLIIFPLFVFFWFGILTVMLTMLSKSADPSSVLLVAMTLVAAVRITAYYNEDLSKDLAKMLPFALLGIFLVDISFFSFGQSMESLKLLPTMWKPMIYYFGFVVAMEFVLRIFHGLFGLIRRKPEE